MIYVFNSGFRGRYTQNVLNTLLLPEGFVNRYRYRSRGDRVNISAEHRELLLDAKKGTEVAIVFIDRYTQPGYRYFPFRLGKLVEVREDGDQMFFFVKMGPYIWSHASAAMSQRLWTNLEKLGIPRLTHGDPKETNDGSYAVIGDSMFTDKDQFKWGDEAWEPIAKEISGMPAFNPTKETPEYPVFARAQLFDNSGTKRVKPSITRKGKAYYRLSRGTEYVLNVRYLFPPQHDDVTNEARLSVNVSDSIRRLPDTEIRINAYVETAPQRLAVKRFADDSQASIDFHFDRDTQPGVLGSDASLAVQIGDARWFWVATGLIVLIFVFGGALSGMDVPVGQRATFKMFWAQLTGLKGLGALVQAGCLFLLARLIGKSL